MPLPAAEGVYVELAWPAAVTPLVGDIEPLVALQATGVIGTAPEPEVSTASELVVRSAVTVDVPETRIEVGDASAPSTSQGSESAVPVTEPQPVLPGPALQPHQLFSAVTVLPETTWRPATLLSTMRFWLRFARPLLCTRTPVALPTMVLPVNSTGLLPEKFWPAIH